MKKIARGFTLYESMSGISILVGLGLFLGALYVALHFIGKFW